MAGLRTDRAEAVHKPRLLKRQRLISRISGDLGSEWLDKLTLKIDACSRRNCYHPQTQGKIEQCGIKRLKNRILLENYFRATGLMLLNARSAPSSISYNRPPWYGMMKYRQRHPR